MFSGILELRLAISEKLKSDFTRKEIYCARCPVEHDKCFVEIVTTSQSINELNYFPNCDTLQARQPFGNYSVLLYLYFTVIIFLIRLLCVTYRFRTTLTKNKQQFETHGFGCVSQQNNKACMDLWRFFLGCGRFG